MLPATRQRPAALREMRSRSVSKSIPLGRYGLHETVVDDADYVWLSGRGWYRGVDGYVRLSSIRGVKSPHTMHRIILGLADPRRQVDHIDGDRLNNQRSNLRVVSNLENSRNSRKHKLTTSSQFKGVTWFADRGHWVAQIMVNRRRKYLGAFSSEIEAARAYDAAALYYFGEYACFNFPGDVADWKPKQRQYTSAYRGVRYRSDNGSWQVSLTAKGQKFHLGHHDTEVAAAKAYDAKVRELGLDPKRLNFPEES